MDKADMRQLLEMSITVGQHGAKAAEVSLIRSVVIALLEQLPTTAEPTKYAPIETSPLAAEIDSMFPKTQPSSQSDQADTKNGPVEQRCGCATVHHLSWMFNTDPVQKIVWCNLCGALTVYDRIHVPVAAQGLLTSVKQPLKESVENSQEESVQSQSKELTKDQLYWLDVGGVMALTTVKEFIEGRLAIKRSDFKEY